MIEEEKIPELSVKSKDVSMHNRSMAKSKLSIRITTTGNEEVIDTKNKIENVENKEIGENDQSFEDELNNENLESKNKQKKYIEEDNREICEAFKNEKVPQDQK